jgi:hypothetical protein
MKIYYTTSNHLKNKYHFVVALHVKQIEIKSIMECKIAILNVHSKANVWVVKLDE